LPSIVKDLDKFYLNIIGIKHHLAYTCLIQSHCLLFNYLREWRWRVFKVNI